MVESGWFQNNLHQVTLPIRNNEPVGVNLIEPKAPIHLTTGNGGPPSISRVAPSQVKNWSLARSPLYSYTRLETSNATHLTWVQISNLDGTVIDTQTVVQHNHGPFEA